MNVTNIHPWHRQGELIGFNLRVVPSLGFEAADITVSVETTDKKGQITKISGHAFVIMILIFLVVSR